MSVMDSEKLKSIIAARMQRASSSLSTLDKEFSDAKAKALEYYYGKTTALELDDTDLSSRLNSNDVAEVIDGAMPSLMRSFAAGDDIVKCTAEKGGDDTVKAEQSTDYINYVLKKNDGFLFIQDWIMDGLLSRIGFAKAYWEDETKEDIQRFQDLTPEEADLIGAKDAGDGFFELSEQRVRGEIKCEVIPPEELWIDPTSKSLKRAPIIAHGRYVTLSDAREMGFEVSKDDVNNQTLDNHDETVARDRGVDNLDKFFLDEDESQQRIHLFEAYTKLDLNGSGIASLYKVFFIDPECSRILHYEPCEVCQIVAWAAKRVPHRLMGKSLADDVVEIQEAKTYNLRSMMNNLSLMSNPRRKVIKSQVDMAAVQENDIGQIIPVDNMGAIENEQIPNVSGNCLELAQYLDQARERRTGIRQFGSTLDGIDDAYQQTATGVQVRENAGNASLELIARNFAETGLKDLCRLILWLGSQHEIDELVIGGKSLISSNFDPYLEIDINLGLGTNDKSSELQRAQMMFDNASKVLEAQKAGLMPEFLTNEGVYEILKNYWSALGFKDHESYFLSPEKMAEAAQANPPQPPAPDPEILKSQAEFAQRTKEHEEEMKFKREQLMLEADLKREDMQMQYDLKLQLASMGSNQTSSINSGVAFGGDGL